MKIERKYILIIIVVAVLVWVTDGAMDAFLFGRSSFRDAVLFREPAEDIFIEVFFVIFYSAFAVVLVHLLTRKRRVQAELQNHLTAIETSMDGIALFTREHEYLYVNDAYANIAGFRSPAELLGKTYSAIYSPRQLDIMEKNVFPVLEKSGKWHGELLANRKDGTAFIQEASITRLPDGGCVCVMRDVTERKKREEALKRSERFLNNIFDSIHDPFCIFDPEYRIVRANAAYAELKNKAIDDIIDRTCYQVLEGKEEVCEGCIIRKTYQSGDPCAKEKRVRLSSGDELWIEIFTYPILDEDGNVSHVIEYTRDVTERKKSEEERKRLIERLEYLSTVDGLTGLLNRRALGEQLVYEIERSRRYESDLSIILCDLDNLKEINDTYGHLAGDTALQIVASTLRNSLRNVDMAGRYGGDEFLVIVPQTTLEGARNIAEKIRVAIQRTEVSMDGNKKVKVSLSLGIACLQPKEDLDAFVHRVDAALYHSKSEGRNRITVADT